MDSAANGSVDFRRGLSRGVDLRDILGKATRAVVRQYLRAKRQVLVTSVYGVTYELRFPEDRGWERFYSDRNFETGTSDLCTKVLRPGDTVIDVGANIGWYTCLFAKCVGSDGRVHAFEPSASTFARLRGNCQRNNSSDTVTLNQLAVTTSVGRLELYQFEARSHAERAVRPLPTAQVVSREEVDAISLDEYLLSRGCHKVDLVKVDVEGSERDVLMGARELLGSQSPPMWLLELNWETALAFSWSPQDLLLDLSKLGYAFVRVSGAWGAVTRDIAIEDCGHGDNVLCYLPRIHGTRLGALG
jgi:FkbM family methyltransferase